ncbi:hypothetical protein FGO68_gene14325 [Halteria grandinella]|uniref:Uncharacterized protein n=1 Tax=Halteria grandinella TaxID=5974 RepID=A0A8J8NGG8_HALGN|nr:hypothetical protein FGO68_gene14325 [Halteria grandinella]
MIFTSSTIWKSESQQAEMKLIKMSTQKTTLMNMSKFWRGSVYSSGKAKQIGVRPQVTTTNAVVMRSQAVLKQSSGYIIQRLTSLPIASLPTSLGSISVSCTISLESEYLVKSSFFALQFERTLLSVSYGIILLGLRFDFLFVVLAASCYGP